MKLGPVLVLTFTFAGHAQSASVEQARATFQRTCTTCHSTSVITSHRLNQAGWENVVDNMISRGAQATPDEQKEIVGYLTSNFGVGTPAAQGGASGEQSGESGEVSAPPQTPPAPALDESQIARAKQLINSNGCMSCHRIEGEGSFAGPYLGDTGAKHTAQQIRASLVSPSEELAPQNRSVRLVTPGGKNVVGKLLNQDAFTVQLIDASGHLLSFDKLHLREFTIITANSMPSYANKLAPEDLSLLVQYLETLRGTSFQQ